MSFNFFFFFLISHLAYAFCFSLAVCPLRIIIYFIFYFNFILRNKCKYMKLFLKLEFRIKPYCGYIIDILI